MNLKDDTARVKREFDAISTPTQIFIATLVGLGILVGMVLARAIEYAA